MKIIVDYCEQCITWFHRSQTLMSPIIIINHPTLLLAATAWSQNHYTKAAVPLPQNPSTTTEPSRNPPSEQRPNKPNQSWATTPTMLASTIHYTTTILWLCTRDQQRKARPAPAPPKLGTAEKYKKELPPLPNLGNDRYKTLPPLPKAVAQVNAEPCHYHLYCQLLRGNFKFGT